ncbi:glycosyltransferase family 4 protein [Paucibacter sediminis]|uniref:Glycosyltransferase family 4 protein n=1 Tax=Paucibacter sediminis TaxID=3019553 RepID=A0AA95NI45_9BURK|nr:glycosyltransferase family 4 protein [Paucibacter sp. S2-9]WIT09986.1 glycosyltransferase family 4 protein [Paucibacter sp. S2-9]
MKVLLLSQHFWPESFRINEVAQSLVEQGCEVTVLTGKPNYPEGQVFPGYRVGGVQRERHEGYEIVRVPLLPRGQGGARKLVLNYLSFLCCASVLGPWALRGQRFDVIFVYGTSPILQAIAAIVLKWIKRAALVTWVQDLWPDSLQITGFVKNPRLLAAVAVVVRWIYRRNDLLLVQSEAFVAPVQRMAGGTPVAVHHNPGDRALSASGSAALSFKPGLFHIVFAGNLGTVQALETVLDAAELLGPNSGIHWHIIGSGARGAWLAEQVRARGLGQVTLPGRFEPAQMPAIFAQADALLVSLIGGEAMSQTIPSKIQAYLAAGRPLLASMDGEGARVVNEAGAGLSSPAQDAAALAVAARRLQAMSPAERAAMGRAGQRYFDEYFEPARLARALRAQFERARAGHERSSE